MAKYFALPGNASNGIGELYRVAITGNIPLVSIESGNSVQMIKRCYWDVKHFDEGLRWFGLTLPIPVKRRQEPFLMPLASFGSA